ncbi:MAG: hypothetical protein EOP49_33940 [Sphingobacteriales bacterium]|nr:MAG: hypothetical protein EOP49_33940 [Sphingobacteriales bacterium]
MVLEYYDRDSSNQVAVSVARNFVLASQLLNLSVTAEASGFNLQWLIGQSEELEHFEIERSDNGTSFQTIKTIAAHDQTKSYSYLDATNSYNGISYYRVKLVEASGTSFYSKTVAARKDLAGISIYPTFNVAGNLYIASGIMLPDPRLVLRDLQGKTVKTWKINSLERGQTTLIPLPESYVLHGWFILQLASEGSVIKNQRLYFP